MTSSSRSLSTAVLARPVKAASTLAGTLASPMGARLSVAAVIGGLLLTTSQPAMAAAAAAAAAAADPGPIGRPKRAKLDADAFRAGLEVYLNGEDMGFITVAGLDKKKGIMTMPAEDLRTLRIIIDPALPDDADIDLASVPGLKYVYDEPGQLLKLTIDPAKRSTYDIAVAALPQLDPTQVRQVTGFLLNYDLYAASGSGDASAYVNGMLEGRVFSPYGTLSTTGSFNSLKYYGQSSNVMRLDTTWRMIDAGAVRSYAAGDIITGSVGWSGAYRLGGIQIQSAFAQRPDIVTTALPQFGGTSAVPSTVELYVNNSQVYSGKVPSGPFILNQLPQLSGGDVRMVTRDANGNERVVKGAYYYSPDLIRQGLFDYSAEMGLLRYGYGQRSFDYGEFAATASARYGISGNLTAEGHGELGPSFVNIGAGLNQRLGGIGVLELAGAISSYEGRTGQKFVAQINTLIHGFSAYAGTERRFGQYFDLGRVSAVRNPEINLSGTGVYEQILASTLGARSIDRFGFGGQLPFDHKTNISVGYTRLNSDITNYEMLNISASRSLGGGFGLLLNGFKTLSGNGSTMMLGVTKSFGSITTMASAQRSDGQTSFDMQASGSSGRRQGAINWAVLNRESDNGPAFRSAMVGYRSGEAWLQAGLQQQGGQTRAVGQVSGSVIAVGGEVLPVNRVGDSFVLVRNAGPEAVVMENNVQIGKAGKSGTIFLPDGLPLRETTISLDPTNVPVGWQVDETQKSVVTGWRNGAVVDFKAHKVHSAVVKIVDDAGKPIEPGYVLKLDGGKDILVGYGGEAYLEDAKPQNAGLIDLGVKGVCRVAFAYREGDTTQPVIGPVPCKMGGQ
ncbi:fimbria/pilus outer membrane usher protein [Sphingomonas parapaucimobilis]|uniref:fimbria/pilus outer membrane usher protein n=1 Tax=Sphingomonas parapaucimobilis TaxID=28213 RepID=UPI00391B8753